MDSSYTYKYMSPWVDGDFYEAKFGVPIKNISVISRYILDKCGIEPMKCSIKAK